MQPRILLSVLLLFLLAVPSFAQRQTLNFNPDWRFVRQDIGEAKTPSFDDSGWLTVSCPHTYNDVDTFDDYSLSGHRGEQNQWGGRTWYRKTFTAPADWKDKKVYIEFESVRQQADVYLNGQRLGSHKTGFTPFGFDLAPHLKIGERNVLAVMVDNRFLIDPHAADGYRPPGAPAATAPAPGGSLHRLQEKFNESIPEDLDELQPNQIPWNNPHWHPAHGGIYRNVRLHLLDPLHIELPLYSFLQTAGPYLYTTDVSVKAATVHFEIPVQNHRDAAADIEITAEILDREGKAVASLTQSAQAKPNARAESRLTITIPNPHLWEPSHPYLYRAVCTLRAGGKEVDRVGIPLGIRTLRWDKDRGLFINNHHEKLRGWGQKPTDEWPGIGNAQPDWLHYFTLDLMKQAGANFVRWGHCPGGPAHIAAADRLGLLTLQPGVDGEADTVRAAWKLRSMAFRDVIIYYRNHPSILIWEGGNQKVSREHAAELRGHMDQYDPHGQRAYAHRRSDKTTAEFQHVLIGTEGGREFPHLPVVEGEYNREESPRRVWDDQTPRTTWGETSQPVLGYPEAKGMTYQLTSEQFAVNQIMHWVKKLSPESHAGGANWIFSDSTSGGRVPAEVCRTSGEVDGVRLPKEAYYVCRVLYSNEPQIHIIGHWNYPEGTTKTVCVAANTGADVELFVNNKSVGRAKAESGYLYTFPDVKFEPGEIRAVSSYNNEPVTQTKKTAGPPAAVKLSPITGPDGLLADGADVLLVDVEIVDKDGIRVPTFDGRCTFTTSGPAIWRGGYNSGKPNSINHPTLDLEAGINRVSLRSTLAAGPIRLTATIEGLPPATLEVESKPFPRTNGYTLNLPTLPPQPPPSKPNPQSAIRNPQLAGTPSETLSGKLLANLSYSGPSKPLSIQTLSAPNARIYADQAHTFTDLPAVLVGGEYLQLPNADRNYHALDLIQLTAARDLTLYIAHDDRLPRPSWLTTDFQSTGQKLTLPDTKATLFKRTVKKDSSLTLGGNTDSQHTGPSALYIVFAVPHRQAMQIDLKSLERGRVLKQADAFLKVDPTPITHFKASRSAGGPHDYFSEGDYWWPDPKNPDGPYIQRDGMTNPDNFVAHRHALMQLSIQTAALAAAHTLTDDARYSSHALKHWRAWFIDDATRMNPQLQYAQAIHGRTTGRGIGIIDTLHLVEVARAIQVLEAQGAMKESDLSPIKRWFRDYLAWMTTSKNGLDEMKAENNHGTCWVAQVAAFASLVGDEEKLALCRQRYKEVLLPNQMAEDGSFPRELKRTKPYGYALFNLDALAAVCQIASTPEDNLYTFTLPDGRNFRKAVDYMFPYIQDKSKWPLKPDVMFWEFWPVRQPALLFASRAYNDASYLELWKTLEADPTNEEVLRNWPLRQPLLWVD